MKEIKKIILAISMITPLFALGQQDTTPPRDGFYDKTSVTERQALPYPYVSQENVFWQRRVWRVIDTREKINLPFKYEVHPLVTIFLDLVKNNEITVYKNEDFTGPMTPQDVAAIGGGVDSQKVFITQDSFIWKKVEHTLDPEKITKYRIKEDWFFDKESSTMQVRIIGVAPVLDKYDDQGTFIATIPMFWVYFPTARNYLVHYEAFNQVNDAHRLTWSDMFDKRLFDGYITKVSNVFDRRIQDYSTGVEALRQSQKADNDIADFEQSLWSY